MSTRPLFTLLLSAAALAGFVYSRSQQSRWQQLRARHEALAAEAVLRGAGDSRAGGDAGQTAAAEASSRMATPAGPLTPAERQELMRLRSQVTELKQRQRGLAAVTNENVRLRGVLSASSNYYGGKVPVGYLRREDARQRGAGSPEASLETLLWAVQHRDFPVVQSLFVHSEPFESDHGESFFRDAGKLMKGYRIVKRKDPGNGTYVLEVEFGPAATTEVGFVFRDGRWMVEQL